LRNDVADKLIRKRARGLLDKAIKITIAHFLHDSNENIRGTVAVVLLVLLKQADINFFQNDWLLQCTEWFLLLLKEKAAFIQDISCSGLCHLYNIAIERHNESAVPKKTIAESIASEVIRSLTISEHNLAKELAVRDREAARELERQAAALGERLTDVINRQQQEPTVAGGGGGGNAQQDPLAAAASRAAAELGLNPENLAPGTNRNTRATDISDYGIYSTICKVAKKTGDPSIIFGCFSLLRRDPRGVERKKFGKKKARRSFQFSKR
jgi:ribosomal protein S9